MLRADALPRTGDGNYTRDMSGEGGATASAEWEEYAGNWIAWTRAPGLDSYWRYRPALFDLLPEPGRATLTSAAGKGA